MLNEFPIFVNFKTQQRIVKGGVTTRQKQFSDIATHLQ
jgi:hypothetical protein